MPRFGGFNLGSIGGALVTNAVGSIAQQVLPRSVFGGFGIPEALGLNGQSMPQSSANRTVSLRPKPAAARRVYGNGLLQPLAATGGLIWPYTPTITYNHQVTYTDMALTHANQDFHVYNRTPAVKLQVSGEFSVQNQMEGAYAMAALHFLRTVSKMNFGENDPQAGTPPPVLLFNAYGPFVFNDTPVIVNDFSMEFPDSVDYVQVQVQGTSSPQTIPGVRIAPPIPAGTDQPAASAMVDLPGVSGTQAAPIPNPYYAEQSAAAAATIIRPPTALAPTPQTYTVWLPSLFKISCTLIVQHTPNQLRKRFNLDAFRNGAANQKDFV